MKLSEPELAELEDLGRIAAQTVDGDSLLRLLAAYREAVALNARYRAALQWCLDEGGWQLLYYENTGPPPAGVFVQNGYMPPALTAEAALLATLAAEGAEPAAQDEDAEPAAGA